jgi:hypothetical protein
MTDWVILRTRGPNSTLRLADGLAEAGFHAWTPVDVRDRWAGKPRRLVEQTVAVTPGYVFVRAERLLDLLTLSHKPALCYQTWDAEKRAMVTKGMPVFTLLRTERVYAKTRDSLLAPMREYEERQRTAAQRRRDQAASVGPVPRFHAGQVVRVDGAYEGLDLFVVEPNKGKMVKLDHPTWMWTMEIPAWQLRHVNVTEHLPEQGNAARAA